MRPSAAFAAVLAYVVSMAPATAQQSAPKVVGAVGAANAAPVGYAPGGSARTLVPGGDIYFRDRIRTKRGGSAQLAFLDRSTLSVGENSDLVIDEFVYKPGGAGMMSASLTKGVLRYVGGDISHSGGTTIRTPTVTIGIRGGIGLVGSVEDAAALRDFPGVPREFKGGTVVVNGYGTLTLRNARSEVVLSKPGFAVFVGSSGEPIGAPVRVSAVTAQAMMQRVTSRAGQHGGAAPAKPGAAAASVASRMATFPLASISAPPAPTVNALDFTSAFSTGNSLARNRSQVRQAVQLQQAIAQIAAATTAANSVTSTSSTGSASPGSGGSGSGGSGSGGSGSGGSGSGGSGSGGSGSGGSGSGSLPSITAYQIDVGSVNAMTIYAYSINGYIVSADIHPGTPFGGTSSLQTITGSNVSGSVITAYMINAGTVTADHIYATYINGLSF